MSIKESVSDSSLCGLDRYICIYYMETLTTFARLIETTQVWVLEIET